MKETCGSTKWLAPLFVKHMKQNQTSDLLTVPTHTQAMPSMDNAQRNWSEMLSCALSTYCIARRITKKTRMIAINQLFAIGAVYLVS